MIIEWINLLLLRLRPNMETVLNNRNTVSDFITTAKKWNLQNLHMNNQITLLIKFIILILLIILKINSLTIYYSL